MPNDQQPPRTLRSIAPGVLEPKPPEPMQISTDDLFSVIGHDKIVIGKLQARVNALTEEVVAEQIRRVAAEQRADAFERDLRGDGPDAAGAGV